MKNYMFDTNIFNKILDGNISIDLFKSENFKIWVTHIQRDELNQTRDEERRDLLNEVFGRIADESIPTESAFWGRSKWGECKWASDDQITEIRDCLNEKKKKENNPNDSLIADTSIKNNFTLVTNDQFLSETTKEFDGKVISYRKFLETEELI